MDVIVLNIYTDGSSYQSPRAGGIGMRFVSINSSGEETIKDFPSCSRYLGATNNQMELQACINALKEVFKQSVDNYSDIIIYTDSSYVVDNYKRSIYQWSKNKWQKKSNAPVLNAEQWKELNRLIIKIYNKNRIIVEIKWVKGHSKNPHNKVVDKAAKKSAKKVSKKRISTTKVRRKKFKDISVNIGCVIMQGQRISIYIVDGEYLKMQKIYRYRYQVVSKNSQFYKFTDFIYSKNLLSAGHSYYVRFNKDNKNPQIIKKFNEIWND